MYLKYLPAVEDLLESNPEGIRWKLPNYTADPQRARQVFKEINSLDTRYRAFVGWTREAYSGETTSIDAAGDRTHQRRGKVNADGPVVRFFGGSTMWGTGVDDNGTIAAVFNELDPQYRVFNHGESGFNVRQNLARLLNLYTHGERADLVVFYNGNNHFTTGCYRLTPVTHAREAQIKQRVRQGSHIHGSVFRQIFLDYTLRLTDRIGSNLGGGAPNSLRAAVEEHGPLSANMSETPTPLGISVGRWR